MKEVEKINVLGTGISLIDMPVALKQIDSWIENKSLNYVCVTGLHGITENLKNEELRHIHNQAGMVTPDGKSVVWYAKLKGHWEIKQVCGPELFSKVCEHSLKKKYKHFFYGGGEHIPKLLKNKMQDRYPGLDVVGTYSPPFRPLTPEEDTVIINMINNSKADIVWIGLSTPKQEKWMSQHLGKLNSPVMIGIGAAFDIHSGLRKRSPKWISTIGFEWFYRLCQEPKRLAKRYIINIPIFGKYALFEMLTIYKPKKLY